MKKFLFVPLWLCLLPAALAFPSFDPFSNATSGGGTAYAAGSGLYHQTNALGEGWALWNGGSGSSTAQVSCVASNLGYSGFPAGFPAPPATAVLLPGTASAVSGYSAALQLSRAVSADPNNLVTNKIYASFLLQIPSLGNLDSGSPIYFGGFATNTGDQSVGLPGKAMKLFLRGNSATAGSSTSYSIGIQNATGASTAAAFDAGGHAATDVLFVVIDYEFGINGQSDVANLWVNPSSASFGSAIPPVSTTSLTVAPNTGGQLVNAADFYLLARSGTSIWGSLLVGDLRVADTWSYAAGGPEIISAPSSVTNNPGATANFSVQAIASATNIAALSYLWELNGTNLNNNTNISGATTPTLSISSVSPANVGVYSVVVANSVASLTNSASLTISGFGITTNPVSQNVLPGNSATFTVTAFGSPTLTYQWQENSSSLADGTNVSGTIFTGSHSPTLQLANISEGDNGALFICIVSNSSGYSIVSSNATLTVDDPILLSIPQNITVSPGGTANFFVSAFGSAPLLYQWQKNGLNLSNSTTASGAVITGSTTTNLIITGAGYLDASSYSIVVTNAHGNRVSSPVAFLTVIHPSPTNLMDELNVRSYGAKGDGITDDTAAFNAAIAAAQSGNHNGVYVPLGHYVISSTLTLNGLEMIGNFAGGWPADNLPLPVLLIRQYAAPGIILTNGASLRGLALDYDQQSPVTTNAPAISLQADGLVIESVRIQNPYDGITTPNIIQPGRARFSDVLIVQPAHVGVQISKCYDFVQYKHVEVICPGAMSTGPAFSFGRVDEGGYTGLVASNCAIGIQFYADTDSGGGFFTGSFAACSFLGCSNAITATGDHKIKITASDFVGIDSGMIINGTNEEVTVINDRFQANAGQAVQVIQAANFIAEGCIFCRAAPIAAPLVLLNNSTTVTVNASQFLPGSTGLELDNLLYRAIVTGNSFEDGGISNYMTSSKQVIAGNLTTVSPPINLSAVSGNAQVALNWTTSLNATYYNVKRSLITGGPYTTIASPSSTSFTDTNVINWTNYYYVVSAVKSGVETSNSVQVSATPQPAPPVISSATPGNSQVTLSWTSVTGATNYNVKLSATTGGPYATVASPAITSYVNSGLTNGSPYYYVVSALVSGNETANSTQAVATPQIPVPLTPTGISTTATNGQVALNWMPSVGANSYYILRALTSGGPYAFIGATPFSSWTDTLVTNGTMYFYVIIADNATGASVASSPVTALPQIVVDLNLSLASGGHQITLAWPGWATNLQIYSAATVTPPVSWQPVTNSIQSNSGMFTLSLPVTNNNQQFFRLVPP